ncbi:MAG: DUF2796 domain-containing protein [Gammaproteobacteria bacterium]|nr:DUF2796 domain-containing protein [Gammaproteobacteria bacterium]
MSLKMSRIALVIVATALAGGVAADAAQEHRQHGAHVHGVGKLNLVVDGGEVDIELETPAANIVGFEHAASSEQDHTVLERAIALLRDGDRLFRFPKAADCRLVHANVESAMFGRHHEQESPTQAHESAPEPHAGEHADIDAGYRFECRRPDEIDRLGVDLFTAFPATERLDVQFVFAGRQGAATLDASNPVLTF